MQVEAGALFPFQVLGCGNLFGNLALLAIHRTQKVDRTTSARRNAKLNLIKIHGDSCAQAMHELMISAQHE
jgi:hypothetical protein